MKLVSHDNMRGVMVEDQGMGISSERKEQLLKSVVSPTNGTKGEWGTGIGLMLCYQLLEQNGGDIAIESQEGQGTKVCFRILRKDHGRSKHIRLENLSR